MELGLIHQVEGAYDVLTPQGEVDIATYPVLRDALVGLLGSGRHELLVDLSETTFIDSTALGTLISARAKAIAAGGSFTLVYADPRTVKLFEITRLSEVFTRFESRATWRGSLAGTDELGA
ncbi:MAG: anti-sigma factor antagonist [Marmoricola sp.]|nr:anti-sigma factor antagonist [Marmoricola sp.]